jgi:N-acetylmuramoyl-L-alanine amidase
MIAAFSLVSLAAMGASGAAPAFGASEILDSEGESLLPQSVVSAARDEGETPVDYTIIPELPAAPSREDDSSDADATDERARAGSLSQLVERHAGLVARNREEECLAVAVYFEARSEGHEGQLAVARVIINRAQSGRFPSSLCGVVMQPGQFSFVRGGGFPPIARGSRDWQEAVAIARVARDGLWESRVPKALFFHARRVSPGWRLTRIAAVGNHVFYR